VTHHLLFLYFKHTLSTNTSPERQVAADLETLSFLVQFATTRPRVELEECKGLEALPNPILALQD
jgi:hypothetical protein